MWNKCLPDFLAVLTGLLLVSTLYAQKDSTAVFAPSYSIGLQYGMSWNTVQFSPVVEQTTFNGQRLALVMRYISDPNLGIQIEAAYDQRGWSETRDSLLSSYSREIDYLELAFFSHIAIGNRRIQPIILLGSYLSYPIAEAEIYPAEWIPHSRFYYDEKLPERLQFGLAGGLGFEVSFNRFSLQFDGRYRSALGGIFSTTERRFTFSNSRGFTAQMSCFFRL